MFKFWSSIKKEVLLLINDRVGIAFMFIMPLLLVIIISIIQDSAFKLAKENKISLLIINHDKGTHGEKLIKLLKESGFFDLEEDNEIPKEQIIKELSNKDKLTALHIDSEFSSQLDKKTNQISSIMIEELGLKDSSNINNNIKLPSLNFYHDPVLQENYHYTIVNVIYSFLNAIESSMMVENFCKGMGFEKMPVRLENVIKSNRIKINTISATSSDNKIIPNSTQHNVPAWTIFAMFFMVVSLGNNIVKEKNNGSFIRLKTLPVNFALVLSSKMLIYLIAAILQVVIIFSIGIYLFPLINLPQLILPSNILGLLVVVLVSALSAVSYALLIGSLAKTQEQANGFGAVSIIIFAALGGIWVPVFIMPDYLKFISNFSPLQWCLEGFYNLFLKNGVWNELLKIIMPQFIFIVICQLITFFKLKVEKII